MSRLHDIIRKAIDDHDREWASATSATSLDAYFTASATAVEDAIVEASGGPDHIVRADEDGWTLRHPIHERFEGTLFECATFPLIRVAAEQGAFYTGQHRVWIDPAGVLLWEEIEGAEQ